MILSIPVAATSPVFEMLCELEGCTVRSAVGAGAWDLRLPWEEQDRGGGDIIGGHSRERQMLAF